MDQTGNDDARFAEALEEMPPSFPPEERNRALHDGDPIINTSSKEQKSLLRRFIGLVGECALILVAGLAISIVLKTFFLQAFTIPSASMEQTLIPGDEIMVNKLAHTTDDLDRGDIVVFEDPGMWLAGAQEPPVSPVREKLNVIGRAVGLLPRTDAGFLVKRMIGKSGDHVVCCDAQGRIEVNGVALNEAYLSHDMAPSLQPFDVVVPEGHMWVMGDNRSNSKDSRFHQSASGFGFVPEDLIQGRAWIRLSPLNRFGLLEDYSRVFADVPDPDADVAVSQDPAS